MDRAEVAVVRRCLEDFGISQEAIYNFGPFVRIFWDGLRGMNILVEIKCLTRISRTNFEENLWIFVLEISTASFFRPRYSFNAFYSIKYDNFRF